MQRWTECLDRARRCASFQLAWVSWPPARSTPALQILLRVVTNGMPFCGRNTCSYGSDGVTDRPVVSIRVHSADGGSCRPCAAAAPLLSSHDPCSRVRQRTRTLMPAIALQGRWRAPWRQGRELEAFGPARRAHSLCHCACWSVDKGNNNTGKGEAARSTALPMTAVLVLCLPPDPPEARASYNEWGNRQARGLEWPGTQYLVGAEGG